jgi:hypothetical protein
MKETDMFMKEEGSNGFVCTIPAPQQRVKTEMNKMKHSDELKDILSALKTLNDMKKSCLYYVIAIVLCSRSSRLTRAM